MTHKVFIGLCLLLGLAHTAPGASLELIDEQLRWENTENALDGMEDKFLDALDRQKAAGMITEIQYATLKDLGKRIYRGKNLLAVFRLAFSKYTRNIDVREKLQWIKTPIGQKLYKAIDESYSPGAGARMARYFERHAGATLKGNRLTVLNTYMRTSRTLELYGMSHKMCDFAVLMGLNGFKPKNSRESASNIMEKLRPKAVIYRKLGRNDYLRTFVYLFRKFDNDLVDKFSKFEQTTAGQRNNDAYFKAMELTLKRAGETLMKAVAKQ